MGENWKQKGHGKPRVGRQAEEWENGIWRRCPAEWHAASCQTPWGCWLGLGLAAPLHRWPGRQTCKSTFISKQHSCPCVRTLGRGWTIPSHPVMAGPLQVAGRSAALLSFLQRPFLAFANQDERVSYPPGLVCPAHPPWSQPTHPHFLLPRSCPGRLGSGGGSRSLPFECLPRLFGLVPTRLGSCSRPEIRSAVTT